jgi:acetate kinase
MPRREPLHRSCGNYEAQSMKIMVLNSGSSSLRFQLIETSPEQIEHHADRVLGTGMVEKIGTGEAIVSYRALDGTRLKSSREIFEHREAVNAALACVTNSDGGVIGNPEEIEGIGHRVVHGGERFGASALMTDEVVQHVEDAIELAPLHNPHNLKGFYAAREVLPHAKQVAVFDTAFHHTLPPHAFLYGLPYALYPRHGLRRYGFHGTSHRYLTYRYARIHGKPKDAFKLITCHLGNGCSVCAIDHGRSVDTSMGFTPLEGLLMGTRAGDVDVAAVLHVMAKEELTLHEVSSLLNKHSGLYGVSGISNDMRDLLSERDAGNDRAALAIEIFCYRVKIYIGAYFAALNGVDAVIFAGGIGERAPAIRAQICESLGAIGIAVDPAKNTAADSVEANISTEGASTPVWVIPTNEELLIARDTLRCILGIPHP